MISGKKLLGAAAVLLALSGCGITDEHEDARGRGDAPVAGKYGDDSPAFCTNMPDEFGNVCGKCLKAFPPWAVVVTTQGDYGPSNLGLFQAPEQCGGTVVKGASPAPVSTGKQIAPPDDDS